MSSVVGHGLSCPWLNGSSAHGAEYKTPIKTSTIFLGMDILATLDCLHA